MKRALRAIGLIIAGTVMANERLSAASVCSRFAAELGRDQPRQHRHRPHLPPAARLVCAAGGRR